MKKGLTLLVLASVALVVVLLMAGMALAAKDNATTEDGAYAAKKALEENKTEKNMTYGQCVVAGVQVKNACYEATKQAKTDCMVNATSDVAKQCKADYKKDMKQCKADFKATKKECIRTTKPGLWQRLRYSLA